MSIELDMLKQQAAKLSEAERAELALSLIESLDPVTESDEELDEAWRLEAERRAGEVDRGEVQPIPGDEVFARIQGRLA